MNEEELQKSFGGRVRDCRKAKGLTQEALAARINMSVDTISNIERGFSATKLKTAAMIAEALEVELVELFGGTKEASLAYSPELQKTLARFIDRAGEEHVLALLVALEATLVEKA